VLGYQNGWQWPLPAIRPAPYFERYNIVSDGDLKEAVRKLEIAFTPQTTTLLTTLPDPSPANPLN
jgi:hypothetical protein